MRIPAETTRRRDKALLRLRPVARACLSPFFRVRAYGLEHLPGRSGFVLLAKHQRWEDIPLLGLTVPRPLYYVAKAELFRFAPFGWVLSSLGGIPLNRDRPLQSRRSLRGIIEHLKSGEGVVIFPEGTYYRDRMGPPRRGLVRMVLSKTSPPFVPVGIRYRKGLRTDVDIRFGRPVPAETGMEARHFLDRMMKEIARLSGL
ncbi:MAG: lysophospholipid acyltransferase family protein [Thermodesulfobacteriota bacterium]